MLRAPELVRRFFEDESGQDLIEYGLLAAIIAIAGVAVLPLIGPKMGNAFLNWGTQVNNVWVPLDPVP